MPDTPESPTTHGLQHEGAAVVVNAGNGWYVRQLEDGSVNIAKYRVENPHAHEQPVEQLTLTREQWNIAVVEMHVKKKESEEAQQGQTQQGERPQLVKESEQDQGPFSEGFQLPKQG